MAILEKLNKAISEFFKGDPTCPSVIASWLPNEQVFYVAIHRYKQKWGGDRDILCSVRHSSLETAVSYLAKDYLIKIGRGQAVEALICEIDHREA